MYKSGVAGQNVVRPFHFCPVFIIGVCVVFARDVVRNAIQIFVNCIYDDFSFDYYSNIFMSIANVI